MLLGAIPLVNEFKNLCQSACDCITYPYPATRDQVVPHLKIIRCEYIPRALE